MTKFWIGAVTLALASGVLFTGGSNPAMAACKTGTPHCLQATGLQKKLQDKLKAGGGEVGGGDINCKNTTHCGGCASDWTNCGSAARHGGGQVVSRGPRRITTTQVHTNTYVHAWNGSSHSMHR